MARTPGGILPRTVVALPQRGPRTPPTPQLHNSTTPPAYAATNTSASTSSDTGGSIAALVDGSFGTYQFTRSINAAGQGTSAWSGTQAKRMESSGEWSDSGPDDETTYESITTQAIDDAWTDEVTDYSETTRYGGVDQEPYNFTLQDTYETTNETQRQTAEDSPNPFSPTNHLNNGINIAHSVADNYTNYNNNGFGNAGTGSGSVDPGTGSGSGSGSGGPETGPLPDGGYWEYYDDGSYWYYAEYDDGHNLTYWEDSHHETFSINTAFNVAQGAGSAAGAAAPEPPEYVPRPNVGDLDTDGEFQRSGRYADGTYWTYVEDDEGNWSYIKHDGKGNILKTESGRYGMLDTAPAWVPGGGDQYFRRSIYDNLAKNSHHNHSNSVNNHVNSMRNTPTYDTTHGNFENGLATADVGYGSGNGSSSESEYYPPTPEVAPANKQYLPSSRSPGLWDDPLDWMFGGRGQRAHLWDIQETPLWTETVGEWIRNVVGDDHLLNSSGWRLLGETVGVSIAGGIAIYYGGPVLASRLSLEIRGLLAAARSGITLGGGGLTTTGAGVLALESGAVVTLTLAEAMAITLVFATTPGGIPLTQHAVEDSLVRHGFERPFGEIDDIIAQAQWRTRQTDGAIVHIHKVAGRGRKYRIVIEGDGGIVTAIKNLSPSELRRLATRYGFQLPW